MLPRSDNSHHCQPNPERNSDSSLRMIRTKVVFIFDGIFFIFTCCFLITWLTASEGLDEKHAHLVEAMLLKNDPTCLTDENPITKRVLDELSDIHRTKIKPLEEATRYPDLRKYTATEADVFAKPIVLVVGPWSTGKSTLINYLLGAAETANNLYTGVEPTTADFTVISYGHTSRIVEGKILVADPHKPFASLGLFGEGFVEHLTNIEADRALLRNVTFVDTPGFLENRKVQHRGYPYNDVMSWLVQRADLVIVVFDPSKLDVGSEMESLFHQVGGKQSAMRIVLNKAESINQTQLIKAYGALFWALSPLMNVKEAPRVYVGSFRAQQHASSVDPNWLKFMAHEQACLLKDLRQTIVNRIFLKIASMRQHAIRVRSHTVILDSFVTLYKKHASKFDQLLADPTGSEIRDSILATGSKHKAEPFDLDHADVQKSYSTFFKRNPPQKQGTLSDRMLLDNIDQSIDNDLPNLLKKFEDTYQSNYGKCDKNTEQGPGETEAEIERDETVLALTQIEQNVKKQIAAEIEELKSELDDESTVTKMIKSPDPTLKKCPLYRQKCEETIDAKQTIIVDRAIEISTAPKCILYRKSCQEANSDAATTKPLSTIEATVKEQKIDQLARPSTTKCPKYRKTCQTIDTTVEQSTPTFVIPTVNVFSVKNENSKCPLYRKSCSQKIQEGIAKKEREPQNLEDLKPAVKMETNGKKYRKEPAAVSNDQKPSVEPAKCPRYRKRCQWEPSHSTIPLLPSLRNFACQIHAITSKFVADEQKVQPKCPKYRKTCSETSAEEKKDNTVITLNKRAEKTVENTETKFKQAEADHVRSKWHKNDNYRVKMREGKKTSVIKKDLQQPKVSREPIRSVKCPLYRKTCSAEALAEQSVSIIEEISVLEKFKLLAKTAMASFGFAQLDGKSNKCPKYRKSCSVAPHQEKSITEQSQAEIKLTPRQHTVSNTEEHLIALEPINDELVLPALGLAEALLEESEAAHLATQPDPSLVSHVEKDLERHVATRRPERGCKLYRKSCLPLKHDGVGVAATPPQLFAIFSLLKRALTPDLPESRCPRYRKSCTHLSADQQSESQGETGSAPARAAKVSLPTHQSICSAYRKSCRKSQSASEPVLKMAPPAQPAAVEKKCPRYRKSCAYESGTTRNADATVANETMPPQPLTEGAAPACPKYRKSCSLKSANTPSSVEEKSDDDYIYILDERTGKLKKYCKKKKKHDDPKSEQASLLRRVIIFLCAAASSTS